MNGEAGYGAEFRTPSPADLPTRRDEKHIGLASLVIAGAVLAVLGSCTFVEQTDDLLKGGPGQRIHSAKQRQSDAIEEQRRLGQAEEELARQQAAEEQKLREMRNGLASQDARIARARENKRITEAEEQRLRVRVDALNGEIRDLDLKMQAAQVIGNTEDDAGFGEKLEALRQKANRIEAEIRSLEE